MISRCGPLGRPLTNLSGEGYPANRSPDGEPVASGTMDEGSSKALSQSGKPAWPADDLPPEACSLEMRRHVLRLVPYFAALTEEELDVVHAAFTARHMLPGDVLVGAGDPAETLAVIVSGRVKLVADGPTGTEHVVDVLGPGDSFGALPLLGQERNENRAEALTGGCILVTTTTEFGGLVTRFPNVAVAVLEDVSARLRSAQGRLQDAATAPVEERLASTLLTLSERFGQQVDGGWTLGAPLSQEDLAALVGTTLESVNRVLAGWRRRGWVETGRLKLVIRDRAALEALDPRASADRS